MPVYKLIKSYTRQWRLLLIGRLDSKILLIVFKTLRFLGAFLVGAFLQKRVDYSHSFSSVFFFDTAKVTKIVLPKVVQIFNCTCWPRKLNQKGFSFFPRNIQYRDRSPSVFLALSDFFEKKTFPQGVRRSIFFIWFNLVQLLGFSSAVEENTLILWSRFVFEPRYGAYLGRSRLV